MKPTQNLSILVLCTVSTGLDAIAEVHRRGFSISGIIGLNPNSSFLGSVSGFVDVNSFAQSLNIPSYYVNSYNLNADADRCLLMSLDFDVVWVAGWQRLIPSWLIHRPGVRVIGGHGSPDGIAGGRGRSPQNWALLLGCSHFDLALFLITAGIDDGPIIAQRTFFYKPYDDIQVSYYRVALAMADMVCELLLNPASLDRAEAQSSQFFYYPQRKPEDGFVDWNQPADFIARQCRALTKPYPGLRTSDDVVTISIMKCQPFDDLIDGQPGEISHCFQSGDFLVNVLDGRLLIREWSLINNTVDWKPEPHLTFNSVRWQDTLNTIITRHTSKYPLYPLSARILRQAQS